MLEQTFESFVDCIFVTIFFFFQMFFFKFRNLTAIQLDTGFQQRNHILKKNVRNLPFQSISKTFFFLSDNFPGSCKGHGELSVVVVLGTGSWPEDMLHGPLQTVGWPSCGLPAHLVCRHNQFRHMAKRRKHERKFSAY